MCRYRQLPTSVVTNAMLAAHILSFCFIFTTLAGTTRTNCRDAVTAADNNDGLCVFSAITFQVGSLALFYFWYGSVDPH
jgi:hypothetical protein